DTGRFTNFAKAAKLLNGDFEGIYFNDSDVYKLLEGTAYSLADHPDPALEKHADNVIAWIAAAQLPNGYLNSYFSLREQDKKWTQIGKHELYCAGHLIEAAVAYKRATGKDSLLNVAEKFSDHIIDVFCTQKSPKFGVPGHEEIELALIKLYQLTGKEKYLTLSKHFVDVRGDQSKRNDKLSGAYQQDHVPIREQSEIVGHAVRAVYLYAGVADNAAYSGDQELINAIDRLWNDVVNKKMYITGGIGARHEGEAFGNAYELPNRTAYCETCAAIGLVFWAHRMNLLHGDAKYADVVERAIYNGVLSGIGRDGKSFFYVNPLESTGNHHRQPFFDCACCPTNVVRFLPSLPGYQYAVDKDGIIINQFIQGKATIELPDGTLNLEMKTDYPWETHGDKGVEFTLVSAIPKNDSLKGKEFQIKVRNPAWYRHDTVYQKYHHKWGDKETGFKLSFPIYARRIIANPQVVANCGRVAIQRGPLIYCFEQVDNEVPVLKIKLARDPEFKEEFRKDLLGGIVVLKCKNADGRELTAIPYYAWDHRQPGAMSVWVRQQGLSKLKPIETENALYAELKPEMLRSDSELESEIEMEISASFCNPRDSTDAVIDGVEPKNSIDHSIPRLTFWEHKGTSEWLELDFGTTTKVSKSSVYWFDDTGNGGCRVPKSWTLSYRDGDQWQPVKTTETFGVEKDKYNTVQFDTVETRGLRLDIQLQNDVSGGVLEWKYTP
ncbi:MAG: glycoside hydrolase family 127 protein, partial [Planctomycetaceae bacterium]|nr:glycoside hydrolase family 127 protein [Planctomycetaceae bacterium]